MEKNKREDFTRSSTCSKREEVQCLLLSHLKVEKNKRTLLVVVPSAQKREKKFNNVFQEEEAEEKVSVLFRGPFVCLLFRVSKSDFFSNPK